MPKKNTNRDCIGESENIYEDTAQERNDDATGDAERTMPCNTEKTNERRRGINVLFILMMITVIITAIGISVANVMKYNSLLTEKEELEKENKELEKRIEEIQYRIDSTIDYEYIIREAHKMGMYFPDEDVYHDDNN